MENKRQGELYISKRKTEVQVEGIFRLFNRCDCLFIQDPVIVISLIAVCSTLFLQFLFLKAAHLGLLEQLVVEIFSTIKPVLLGKYLSSDQMEFIFTQILTHLQKKFIPRESQSESSTFEIGFWQSSLFPGHFLCWGIVLLRTLSLFYYEPFISPTFSVSCRHLT